MSGDASTPAQDQTVEPIEAAQAASEPEVVTAETTTDAALTDPAERLQQLEQELHTLKQEHETLQSQYMRIAADFDNFRKRQSRDQDDMRQQLVCSTLSEILPVVDNFERARQQLNPEGEEAQALHRSYQGLYKQLVDVLKQQGVARMEVVGQEFDLLSHLTTCAGYQQLAFHAFSGVGNGFLCLPKEGKFRSRSAMVASLSGMPQSMFSSGHWGRMPASACGA